MEWTAQNVKDTEMLGRIDLSPLREDFAQGDEPLRRRIENLNVTAARILMRFSDLADDRKALARADWWLDQDSEAVTRQHRRVAAESWDVLVALRAVLQRRRDLLEALRDHVRARLADLRDRHEHALVKARKALEREYRDYLKAEPVHGPSYVASLAEDDDAAEQVRRQVAEAAQILDSIKSARQRSCNILALTTRQREVYDLLI